MDGRAGSRGRGARAFTLVELMVVVAVLTILLAVLIESGQYVRSQGLTRLTVDLLGQVHKALAQYHAAHGCYPPDRFTGDRVAVAGGHRPRTEGIESLVLALSGGQGEHGPFWRAARYQRAWANGDQDSNRIGNQPLYELVDGWGRPLLYYNGYGSGPGAEAGKGGRVPLFAGLDEEAMAKLNDSLRARWIQNNRRPLIDSAGPDGVFNNSDDLQRIAGAQERGE